MNGSIWKEIGLTKLAYQILEVCWIDDGFNSMNPKRQLYQINKCFHHLNGLLISAKQIWKSFTYNFQFAKSPFSVHHQFFSHFHYSTLFSFSFPINKVNRIFKTFNSWSPLPFFTLKICLHFHVGSLLCGWCANQLWYRIFLSLDIRTKSNFVLWFVSLAWYHHYFMNKFISLFLILSYFFLFQFYCFPSPNQNSFIS